MQIGIAYDVSPIPPVVEQTTYVEAGTLKIGIEYRILTDDLVDAAYASDSEAAAEIDANRPAVLDDSGVSLHVCDRDSGAEYLRFDCFDEDPHYHYITPGVTNRVIAFDANANGDMLAWALSCLRGRLPEMLAFAGATSLATAVDQPAVDSVVAHVEALARKAQREPSTGARSGGAGGGC